jgi:hypothetical protein
MAKPFNPRSTTFTNLMLDIIMPSLSPNAWKIICFAMRKTEGWADSNTESGRKEADVIAISQFRIGCGIVSNDTVMNAIDECLSRGYLLREKADRSFSYRLNVDYEIPDVTESVKEIVTESVKEIVTESVNTNSKLVNSKVNSKRDSQESQEILQPQPSLPAKEASTMATAEQYKKRTEKAMRASYENANTGYAHEYPEDVRQIVISVARLWHLPAPPRPRSGKGKQYAYWLESSRALLDACAEFGAGALDLLRDDFEAYMADHGGVAPHTVSTPNSLVNSMLSKAAQLRGGNTAPMWGSKKPQARQTMLDV